MKNISIILFTLFISNVYPQNESWKLFPSTAKKEASAINLNTLDTTARAINTDLTFDKDGIVVVHQPADIDSLTQFHKNNPYILGYTVQLEVSQQNSKIRDARYKILKIQPDVHLEETYIAPNTYLYGGVFYDRNDAYEFKYYILQSFPNAIVISKKMQLPPLEQTIIKREEKE